MEFYEINISIDEFEDLFYNAKMGCLELEDSGKRVAASILEKVIEILKE